MKNKQLIKGSLNVIILKLLGDRERMYGYEITQHVKQLTNGDLTITEGALYPALHKLEADGLISSEIELYNGRNRKYYRLSERGQKEAVSEVNELISFFSNLQLLLDLKPHKV